MNFFKNGGVVMIIEKIIYRVYFFLFIFSLCIFSNFFIPIDATADPTIWQIAASRGLQLSQETGMETLPVIPGGTYEAEFIGEYTAMAGGTSLGWYVAGDINSKSLLFTGPDSPPLTKTFSIPLGVTEIGLYMNPAWYPALNWYSETAFNTDHTDHMWIFLTQNPNEYFIGFEDLQGGGDRDYQDQVIIIRQIYIPDSDNDGIPDPVDNCPDISNSDQTDSDHDGFGDACDNCPNHENQAQNDVNQDGVGDACDCFDISQGQNEWGVDCGNICSEYCIDCTWCGSNVAPIRIRGHHNLGQIDIVFVPEKGNRDKGYDFNEDGKLDDFEKSVFLDDIYIIIQEGYFKLRERFVNPDSLTTNNYKDRFNFYIYTGGFAILNSKECWFDKSVTLPPNFWREVSFTDSAAVLTTTITVDDNCKGVANGLGSPSAFRANRDAPGIVIHESAHSIFGLYDEYQRCKARYYDYESPLKLTNIWDSVKNCEDAVTSMGLDTNTFKCEEIAVVSLPKCDDDNYKGFCCGEEMMWRIIHEQDPGIMRGGKMFYHEHMTRVKYVFYEWPCLDPLKDPPDFRCKYKDTKGILLSLKFNKEQIEENGSEVVESHPDIGMQKGPFMVKALSCDDTLVDSFEIRDPRDSTGEGISITVFPFYDSLNKIKIKNVKTEAESDPIDLAKTLRDHCVSNNYVYSECKTLDFDCDSIKDIDDNCPNIANTDQADNNQNGIGDACERVKISGGAYNFPQTTIYKATFSMDVTGPTSPSGWLKYYYSKTRMNFVSTGITEVSMSGNTATISGTGKINGVSGYTFTATITDGSPDSFGIIIRKADGGIHYSAGPGAISGGDLIISLL